MNEETLEKVRRAGAIAAEARELGANMVDEGVKLLDVAAEVEAFIVRKGARPAFPTNLSINDAAAHYTPSSTDKLTFKRGDLVKVDVGAQVDGYIGDTAKTVEVRTRNWTNLINASVKALSFATEMVGEGVQIGSIGGAIERAINSEGFVPVTNLTGHGLNCYNLHAGLTVANYDDGNVTRLRNDMMLAIEPFATNGAGEVRNGKPGNIYRILRDREVKDADANRLFSKIKEEFKGLPFCERWCTAIDPKAPAHLRTMVRHGILFAYPVLSEIKGGMVSQAEHTVVIIGGKGEITTRLDV
jgi:methionyl aminopeptidase